MEMSMLIMIAVMVVTFSIVFRASGAARARFNLGGINSGIARTSLKGKTREQKGIIKFFRRKMFSMSRATFHGVLSKRVQHYGSQLERRAMDAHGIDAEEVREIPPIRIEEFHSGSRYFMMFTDGTVLASEYQMSSLMFSETHMYAYSYTFDLTSHETEEQTKEYAYEDITNVEVRVKGIEFMNHRSNGYIIGGIVLFLLGIGLGIYSLIGRSFDIAMLVLGAVSLITGFIVAIVPGYSRGVTERLILRLTVAGDEFTSSMNPGNYAAIQGMKAKIREKKHIGHK